MPKDRRIFVTLAVDMDRNPKLSDLNDAQKWLIVKAIMHSREFLTDGVIKLSDWNKLGTKRNRIAVESCGVIVVDEQQSVAILHDYSEHNQTRAEVDAATEAKKTAGSKGGKARAARAEQEQVGPREASEPQAAAWTLPKQVLKQNQAEEEEEEEKELLTHVSSPSHVSTARARGGRAIADHLNGTGHSGEAHAIARAYETRAGKVPGDTLSKIAQAADGCLKSGYTDDQIAAGIDAWAASDMHSPSQIPNFVHKAVNRPAATTAGFGQASKKAASWLAIGQELAEHELNAAAPPNLKEIS